MCLFWGIVFMGCTKTVKSYSQKNSKQLSSSSSTSLTSPPSSMKSTAKKIIHHRNLAYTPPKGVQSDLATLDLFRLNDRQKRPLVLLVHGGTWASGDKKNFESNIVPWWIEHGYVAVPVNFRLASKFRETPVVKPRDQVHDLAAALSWLMNHAEEYKIATDQILLFGYSSGAHLVALLGTDERILREVGLKETQLAGVISLDVHAYDIPYALTLMKGSVVERNIRIIKHLFGQTTAEQQFSSPIHYVEGWAAPALVVSVDADPHQEGSHGYLVSKAAQRYVAALQNAGHQAEAFHDSNETHSSLVLGFGKPGDQVTDRVKRFLKTLSKSSH